MNGFVGIVFSCFIANFHKPNININALFRLKRQGVLKLGKPFKRAEGILLMNTAAMICRLVCSPIGANFLVFIMLLHLDVGLKWI